MQTKWCLSLPCKAVPWQRVFVAIMAKCVGTNYSLRFAKAFSKNNI